MENRTVGFEIYCETFLELFSKRCDDDNTEKNENARKIIDKTN